MKKRSNDFLVAGVVGLLTAFFANIIFINADIKIVLSGSSVPLWALYAFFPIVESGGYFIASRLFRRIVILKQAGRFGVVGLLNFTLDAGILSVLSRVTGVYAGVFIVLLNAISVAIAVVHSYFWNRYWTFKEKGPPGRSEFLTFVVVSAIGIAINSFVVYTITAAVNPFDGVTVERLEVLAKVGAALVSLFWNFLGYKFIVFNRQTDGAYVVSAQ